MADDSPLQNQNLLQGLAQMQQPNPYAIQGPLSMPGFYTGNSGGSGSMPPTDAMGNPIQSFQQAQQAHDAWNAANPTPPQGKTLNSTPSWDPSMGPQALANISGKPVQSSAGGMIPTGQNTGLDHPQYIPATYAYPQGSPQQNAAGLQALNSMIPTGGGNYMAGPGTPQGYWNQGQPQQAAAPAPTNPIDMRQAYLNALSNPGKVTTPGATVPQSDPLGQPSVMDAFLSTNHPSSSSSNSGFFNTLNKLQSMKGTA